MQEWEKKYWKFLPANNNIIKTSYNPSPHIFLLPLINSKSTLDKNKLLSRPLWIILPLRKRFKFVMEKLEQIITTYQQIIQKTELELQNARKRIYYISLLRLILFVGAVANAIIFWSDGWLCLSAFAVLPFILFIWLVKRHNFWFYRKDFLKKKIEINEQELRAMQYDFSDFDDGKEFINPSHLYTLDLDVFGEHSLFQYINRTATVLQSIP